MPQNSTQIGKKKKNYAFCVKQKPNCFTMSIKFWAVAQLHGFRQSACLTTMV